MKLLSAIRSGLTAFRNSYGLNTFDSASDNPQRSSTICFPYDSTREINPYQRRELVKKHRMLRNNLGFVRGIIRTTVRLAIGWGLQPMPQCPDRAFNARALAYWRRHTAGQNFDISGQDKEASMQRLVLSETITDGEMFAVKVTDDFGRPQRQLLKTEMIGDPPGTSRMQGAGLAKSSPENWVDGILANSLGRPLQYSVLQSGTSSVDRRATLVAAPDMLHIYDRERVTQMRGLPWGYTGLNHGVDIIDIAAFEKVAHKLNNAIVGSVTTPTGEVPAGWTGMLAAAHTATATANTRDAVKYLDLHGTSIPIFKAGENMGLFLQGRNSINTTEFAGWLCAQYAEGFGLPVRLITTMATNGTAVRGDLEMAARFFEEVQMLMVDDWCHPNWENIIGTGILASIYPRDYPGVEPLSPPEGANWEGWDAVEWRGPRNITVDRGRDGKLYLEQKRAGWLTDEEWWTMNGEDPLVMSAKIDTETRDRLAHWLSLGLPEDKFWLRELGQVAQNSQPQPDPAPGATD